MNKKELLIIYTIKVLLSKEFGWRIVFFSLSFALLLSLLFIKNLNFEGDTNLVKPN